MADDLHCLRDTVFCTDFRPQLGGALAHFVRMDNILYIPAAAGSDDHDARGVYILILFDGSR